MFKGIFKTLEKKEKQFFLVLLFLILLNAVLETVGIAAIIPLISLVMQDDFLNKYSFLSNFLMGISEFILPNDFYKTNSIQNNLVIAGFVLFLVIFFVKTSFFIFLNYLQATFTNQINYSISTKLFKGYLSLDYIFHTLRHSSNLEHNILDESNNFTSVFGSMLVIFTEGIVLLFIVALLLFFDFTSSIVIFLFLLSISCIIFKFTKNKLTLWGSQRLIFAEKRFKYLVEGLGSIKEIYILQKSLFFLNKFFAYSKTYLNFNRNFQVITNLTRPIFEFVGLFTLTILFLLMLFQGHDLASLMATVGLFLVASFRLLPSVNKIISSIQSIKFSLSSINRVVEEFKIINENYRVNKNTENLEFKDSIIFKNVSFSYPNKSKPALKNISFSINRGKRYGIKGYSGSGKTTLINLILTLISPSNGQIEVDHAILEKNNLGWLKNIGYVAQITSLIDDTIEKNIAFGFSDNEINEQKLKKAIETSQLKYFIDGLKDGIKTRVGEKGQMVSGGQMQRIGIARALYNDPKLIVLDEPTSALDLDTETRIMETIYNLGRDKTVIIVSHRESVLNRCDKILSISDGKIIV